MNKLIIKENYYCGLCNQVILSMDTKEMMKRDLNVKGYTFCKYCGNVLYGKEYVI